MENRKTNSVHVWIYSVLGLLLALSLVWFFRARNTAHALENDISNQYNRAFFELTGYVDNIETQLYKAQLAMSPAQLATVSGDIFREAAAAKACIGQLPSSQIQLDKTARFLAQVGDYTYVLAQNSINGKSISEDEYNTLSSLAEYAKALNESLDKIQSGIMSGELRFGSEQSGGANTVSAASGDIMEDLENVEKAFDGYPSLIYDGPFSEHIENIEPQMLKTSAEVSLDDAKQRAAEFLGVSADSLYLESVSDNSQLPSYTFADTASTLSISMTKRGGFCLYFLKNRDIGEETLDITSATEKARAYLGEKGFTQLVSSYFEKGGGIAVINFAYSQDGVTCYSDLIKVRIALDDGEIIGLETKGWLMNHRYRRLASPVITKEQAASRISSHLSVQSINLAVIPKDSLEEVLCYEFRGSFADRNFIIYINAENGREEKIWLLIESENGVLTV